MIVQIVKYSEDRNKKILPHIKTGSSAILLQEYKIVYMISD